MQVHYLQVIVVDHDDIGADEAERYLEDTKYPNHCMSPTVLSSQTAEIGEWEDDNPLNFTDKQQAEVARLFSPWKPLEDAPKDGTHVLVKDSLGNHYEVWYEKILNYQAFGFTYYYYWNSIFGYILDFSEIENPKDVYYIPLTNLP